MAHARPCGASSIFSYEINRGDVLADRATEVCGQEVLWMNGVSVERFTVAEDGDESRIVRARKV